MADSFFGNVVNAAKGMVGMETPETRAAKDKALLEKVANTNTTFGPAAVKAQDLAQSRKNMEEGTAAKPGEVIYKAMPKP